MAYPQMPYPQKAITQKAIPQKAYPQKAVRKCQSAYGGFSSANGLSAKVQSAKGRVRLYLLLCT
jgi:hypothetical protein